MPEENKTILNASDSRVEESDFIYTGRNEREDVYVGSSAILLTLRDEGILPQGFDVRNFDSQEDFNAYVARLPIADNLRNILYSYNIVRATDRVTVDRPAFVEGQSLQTGSDGKTPIESTVFVYDPANYSTPSIRNNGVGLAIDDSTMGKATAVNYPPEGRVIPQVVRTSQYSDVIPMFLDMVDSDFTRQGIYMGEDFIVTTIRLNPNPSTLTINSSKKISRYTTMTRWVEEHWGDEIDSVSLSGSTFSFFGYFGQNNQDNTGLTVKNRDTTQAYRYIRELVKFYQTNGCIYQSGSDYEAPSYLAVTDFLNSNPEFSDNHPRKGMIRERLYLRLIYDYLTLIGRLESFDIIEDASIPFRFQYNIIFKAEKTIYRLDKSPNDGAIYPSSAVNPADRSYDDISNNLAQAGAFV
jgi:hypothetical protein